MSEQVLYEVAGRVASITLNRPERGNGITAELVAELVESVRRADLDPAVHVLLLAGAGPGFCGGYDLVESAESMGGAKDMGGAATANYPAAEEDVRSGTRQPPV